MTGTAKVRGPANKPTGVYCTSPLRGGGGGGGGGGGAREGRGV